MLYAIRNIITVFYIMNEKIVYTEMEQNVLNIAQFNTFI